MLGGEKHKLEGTNHKRKTCANMCHVLSLLVRVRGTVLFSVKNWYRVFHSPGSVCLRI